MRGRREAQGRWAGLWPRRVLLSLALLSLALSPGAARSAEGWDARVLAEVTLNGRPAPAGTRVIVFAPGDRATVIASGAPSEAFAAPSGVWDLVAELPGTAAGQLQVAQEKVRLEAGQTRRLLLEAVQALGQLQVEVRSAGAPLPEAWGLLLPEGARQETGLSLVLNQPEVVPAGRWTLLVVWETPVGPVKRFVDGVEIGPNGRAALEVDLGGSAWVTVELGSGRRGSPFIAEIMPEGRLFAQGELALEAPTRLPVGRWDLRVVSRRTGRLIGWHKGLWLEPGDKKIVRVGGPVE